MQLVCILHYCLLVVVDFHEMGFLNTFFFSEQKYYRVIRQSDNAGHKLKNTLFCTKPSTPDLTDIFQNIDPRKLKRTSSAVWRQPPRFTLLPRTEQSFME